MVKRSRDAASTVSSPCVPLGLPLLHEGVVLTNPPVTLEHYAPVTPPGVVPPQKLGLPKARVSTLSPNPARLDPYLPVAVVAVVAATARALSSFSVASNCTICAASSPNLSNVAVILATNASATNDNVYDSGHVC